MFRFSTFRNSRSCQNDLSVQAICNPGLRPLAIRMHINNGKPNLRTIRLYISQEPSAGQMSERQAVLQLIQILALPFCFRTKFCFTNLFPCDRVAKRETFR